jgi:hypothetical protein
MTTPEKEELLYQLHIIEALVRQSAEFMQDSTKWEKCNNLNESALHRLNNLIYNLMRGEAK